MLINCLEKFEAGWIFHPAFIFEQNVGMSMSVIEKIEKLLEAPLEEFGLSIVRVSLDGSQHKTLEILVERLDGQSVSIDDCVRASREASAHLDVADLIDSAYVLEVSSPGADRPLIKKADFERFIGHEIKVHTKIAVVDNRKRYKGDLVGVNGDIIVIKCEDETGNIQEIEIPYMEIDKAKLVPNYEFPKRKLK